MEDVIRAIVVPGGGLEDGGNLPPWVRARFDRALAIASRDTIMICLSAGSVYRPPPLNAHGYPIFESSIGGLYLIRNGIAPEKVWLETSSYDTIGNAYFARTIHTEPSNLRRLHIITSQFHVSRVRRIFEWIFGCDDGGYQLSFEATPNVGIDASSLRARTEKEQRSMRDLSQLIPSLPTLRHVHTFLFTKHYAYRQRDRQDSFQQSTKAIRTY